MAAADAFSGAANLLYPLRANVTERRYAPPPVAVSTVIFALRKNDATNPGDRADREDKRAPKSALVLPLVRRTRPPFSGDWALPGGPIAWNESLVDAARQALSRATQLQPRYLEQLYAFGGLDRSADLRVISIVYWALVNEAEAGRTVATENVRWFFADDLPSMAFDHERIVKYALSRLRTKMEYASIAHAFLGTDFTLAELRGVYEAVLGKRIDPANFRRDMLAADLVEETGEVAAGGRHRPAKRYRYRVGVSLSPEASVAEPELADVSRERSAPVTQPDASDQGDTSHGNS